MSDTFLLTDPFYIENFLIIAGFLCLLGIPLFFLKDKSPYYQASWSSIISWAYVLPGAFLTFALPKPWPLVILAYLAGHACKTFYQMVGIYHRTWFVLFNYALIVASAYLISIDELMVFNAMPMIGLIGFISIGILRNNFLHMVQYISLSLICFSLYAWFYLHGGKILMFDHGIYTLIYLYALSEFSIALSSSVSLKIGKFPLRNNINSKIKLEGFIIGTLFTIFIAWSWRRMLPADVKDYWLIVGLICSVFSTFGDLSLSIIRKDLKIKDHGVFIIGRGDLLSRVNKVIFVFPAYYIFVVYLTSHFNFIKF